MDTSKDRGLFYCEVCDCEVKDSFNYLDHINGKKHNLNLGISFKQFKDSTLDEVREMLKKKERDQRLSGVGDKEKGFGGYNGDEEEDMVGKYNEPDHI